jgi:predicted transposase/invertase (TIGR01784 family)
MEITMKNSNQKPIRYEWGPFPLREGESVMDIRYDQVFKAVFTKETSLSRGALSRLITALIGHIVEVEVIIANEQPIDDTRQRYVRFDVVCRTKEGELINVEMSFNPIASEQVRLEYHVARLFVGQDIHGEGKTYYDLKETYQIAILAKYQFFPDEELIHDFIYYDPKTHVSLGGKTRIITVELIKTKPAVGKTVEEMTDAELWAVFFQYLTDEEKRDKIIKIINREEGIAMAVEILSNITQDEAEYARLSNLIKSELDWRTGIFEAEIKGRSEGLIKGRSEGLIKGRSEGLIKGRSEGLIKGRSEGLIEGRSEGLIEGRSEGLIEGRSEGRNEEKLENARKMKSMGLLTEQIQAVTGLSPETIASL